MQMFPQLEATDLNIDQEPHRTPVTLASSFTARQRQTYGLRDLAKAESTLRLAQAYDALEKLRNALGIKSFLSRNRSSQQGPRAVTRFMESLRRADRQSKAHAATYRRAWRAIKDLGIPQVEYGGLQDLEDSDLRMLSDWLEEERYKGYNCQLPWIWSVMPGIPPSDSSPDEIAKLMAEWAEESTEILSILAYCS